MVEARTFTVRDAIGWFARAWRESKPFRLPLVGLSMILVALSFGLPELGNLPRMLGEVVFPFAMAGVMLCARDCVVHHGFDFYSFTRPFREKDMIERLFPYALVSYGLELLTVGATEPGLGSTIQILLGLVITLLTLFLPYLLLFAPISTPQAFKLSASATLVNFRPVILLYLVLVLGFLIVFLASMVGATQLASAFHLSEKALDRGVQFWILGLVATWVLAPPFWLFVYIAFEEIYLVQ